VRTISP